MTSHKKKKPFVTKQAVIFIHGIGEQQPMDTLRHFVEAVIGKSQDPIHPTYWSKPDTLSQNFELRRLQTVNGRVTTHFYEFYWAHMIQDSKLIDIWYWLKALLFRRKRDVPASVRPLWLITRILVSLAMLSLVLITLMTLAPPVRPAFWPTQIPSLPFAIPLLLFSLQALVLAHVGDAARYLSPRPRNINCRHEIRSAGVKLLKRLHNSGNYDRIVVVGHSLGSVIGYDILRHAWHSSNTQHSSPIKESHKALNYAESCTVTLVKKNAESGTNKIDDERRNFNLSQRSLWLEQLNQGFPWRVSDFITLGSPLAHAELLMAKNAEDFTQKKLQRELPLCPPILEGNPPRRFSYQTDYFDKFNTSKSTHVLHHAACFAVTRWSNLYFPSSRLFTGDCIGGPLAPVFGPGIRDVQVSTHARYGFLSHKFYWNMDDRDKKCPEKDPVSQLRKALGLDCQDLFMSSSLDHLSKHTREEVFEKWQVSPFTISEGHSEGHLGTTISV
jgi:hypothetical protein